MRKSPLPPEITRALNTDLGSPRSAQITHYFGGAEIQVEIEYQNGVIKIPAGATIVFEPHPEAFKLHDVNPPLVKSQAHQMAKRALELITLGLSHKTHPQQTKSEADLEQTFFIFMPVGTFEEDCLEQIIDHPLPPGFTSETFIDATIKALEDTDQKAVVPSSLDLDDYVLTAAQIAGKIKSGEMKVLNGADDYFEQHA